MAEKYIQVNENTFSIVNSKMKDKKGHKRFDTREEAEKYVTKARDSALRKALKANKNIKFLNRDNLENAVEKRLFLSFEGLKDLIRDNDQFKYASHLSAYEYNDDIARLMEPVDHKVSYMLNRWGGSIPPLYFNLDDLYIVEVNDYETVSEADAKAAMPDDDDDYYREVSVKMVFYCVLIVKDEFHVKCGLTVEGLSETRFHSLLPSSVMDAMISNL